MFLGATRMLSSIPPSILAEASSDAVVGGIVGRRNPIRVAILMAQACATASTRHPSFAHSLLKRHEQYNELLVELLSQVSVFIIPGLESLTNATHP